MKYAHSKMHKVPGFRKSGHIFKWLCWWFFWLLISILDFATLEEARRAVRMMDGRAIGGYTISVKPDNTALLRTQHHQHGGCSNVNKSMLQGAS